MMLRVRLNRTVIRFLTYSGICTLIFVCFSLFYREDILEIPDRWHGPFLNHEPLSSFQSPADIQHIAPQGSSGAPHPIEDLIGDAERDFDRVLKKQTNGVAEAAKAYRGRRGRHPPPGFDKWVAWAESKGCIIIEDFFDQIYHDLNPFWALPPAEIRSDAGSWDYLVRVRNSTATVTDTKWHFVTTYLDMVKKLDGLLPDADLPINEMDEPRVLVPWDDISFFMGAGDAVKKAQDPLKEPSVDEYTWWSTDKGKREFSFAFLGPFWNFFRAGCDPSAGVKRLVMDYDHTKPPKFPETWPNGTHQGFVKNWTMARDPCSHPHLRNMHGAFIEPISQATSSKLIPVFSPYKLSVNNDILLPTAYYWKENDRSQGRLSATAWEKKRNEVAWRGIASGGRNRVENWTRFHRHRLVSMLNGTQVEQTEERLASAEPVPAAKRPMEEGEEKQTIEYEIPQNFPLPNHKLYPLKTHSAGKLGDWIRSFSNVAFEWLNCFPDGPRGGTCPYTTPWFRMRSGMSTQHLAKHKYLPDVDGNQVSERWREILKSNSVPIKATIWSEWHDSRLFAWKHFVPMDNTYMDLYGILEFLFEHDEYSKAVAHESRWWAQQVLRKEDMLAYTYRLVLEYARVSDPQRHEMGFSSDLHEAEAL